MCKQWLKCKTKNRINHSGSSSCWGCEKLYQLASLDDEPRRLRVHSLQRIIPNLGYSIIISSVYLFNVVTLKYRDNNHYKVIKLKAPPFYELLFKYCTLNLELYCIGWEVLLLQTLVYNIRDNTALICLCETRITDSTIHDYYVLCVLYSVTYRKRSVPICDRWRSCLLLSDWLMMTTGEWWKQWMPASKKDSI